jgi:hypothetical protein
MTEFQEKWLTALESGAYAQTHAQLGRTDGVTTAYCCLGVAACLLDITIEETTENYAKVANALELHDPAGMIVKDDPVAHTETLTLMNDSGRYSFADIAAFCRANPEKVFKTE